MALMETKIIQIENSPYTLNRYNEIMGWFGWNVLNVQITHSQNTETYSSMLHYLAEDGIQTVKTTTINYATVTYQRDKGMANYYRIKEIEEEYQSVVQRINRLSTAPKLNIVVLVVSFFFWIIPGIVYLRDYIKEKKQYRQEVEELPELRRRREKLLKEASILLDADE